MAEGRNEWTRVRHVQIPRRNTEDAVSLTPKRYDDMLDSPIPRVGAFMGSDELESILNEIEN